MYTTKNTEKNSNQPHFKKIWYLAVIFIFLNKS